MESLFLKVKDLTLATPEAMLLVDLLLLVLQPANKLNKQMAANIFFTWVVLVNYLNGLNAYVI